MKVTKEYLEQLGLRRVKRLSSGWIMACCPFHKENRPSFGVHSESGNFHCFACGITGTLVELIAYCKNISLQEAVKQVSNNISFASSLHVKFPKKQQEIILDDRILKQYRFYHKYLQQRGITKETAKKFSIGYDFENNALVFPWWDVWGRLRTIKFRKVDSKKFWFLKEGERKNKLLYLANFAKGCRRIFLVEGEIDALTCWQTGWPAVALGGCSMTQEQAKELMLTGVEEVVLFLDNDEAGKEAKEKIAKILKSRVKLYEVVYPEGIEDANEMTAEMLSNLEVSLLPVIRLGNQDI